MLVCEFAINCFTFKPKKVISNFVCEIERGVRAKHLLVKTNQKTHLRDFAHGKVKPSTDFPIFLPIQIIFLQFDLRERNDFCTQWSNLNFYYWQFIRTGL